MALAGSITRLWLPGVWNGLGTGGSVFRAPGTVNFMLPCPDTLVFALVMTED